MLGLLEQVYTRSVGVRTYAARLRGACAWCGTLVRPAPLVVGLRCPGCGLPPWVRLQALDLADLAGAEATAALLLLEGRPEALAPGAPQVLPARVEALRLAVGELVSWATPGALERLVLVPEDYRAERLVGRLRQVADELVARHLGSVRRAVSGTNAPVPLPAPLPLPFTQLPAEA